MSEDQLKMIERLKETNRRQAEYISKQQVEIRELQNALRQSIDNNNAVLQALEEMKQVLQQKAGT